MILSGITLAGILWLLRSVADLRESVAVFRSQLTGTDGHGGLHGEVHAVRARGHDLADKLQGVISTLDLVNHRLGELERTSHEKGS